MTLEAAVSLISLNSKVRLHPLSKQRENGVVIVGRGDQFLELPPEGLDFIHWLNQGMSVARARERFEARYNPFPDDEVLDVMNAFVECDFIAAVDGRTLAPRHAPLTSNADWFPQRWAHALFSKPVLIAWMMIVAPAAALWVLNSELWPRRADYFWVDLNAIVVLTAMLIWLIGMPMHELAHWLACRAKGIQATITWTKRAGFFPMSQTIMHNIWAIPRGARFLPLAAGMAWDVFALSLALYALYFDKMGWLVLPWLAIKLLKFYVLFIAMALAAQFWLFARMDGYFLVSALLGQRNLQSDTRAWLKSKLLGRGGFETPSGGMKFIYAYSLITLLWGGLFMGQFVLVSLPIKVQLIWESLLKVGHHPQLALLDFYDGLGVLASQVLYYGLLVYAYLRDSLPGRRRS